MNYRRTFSIGAAVVVVDYESGYVETRFDDGAICPAYPHATDAYRETAKSLGYGSDTAALCREHEVAHSLIALKMGLAVSPTLWMVAHGGPPEYALPLALAEEEVVLTFQKVLNGVLRPLLPVWGDLRAMALEMLRYDYGAGPYEVERLRADIPEESVSSRPKRVADRFRDHLAAQLPRHQ
jgi:hypothetical protein